MKKVKLSCIFAFIGAIMLSVTSCTKTDYGDDIARLKNDVAELNDAIKAGKTVTAVTPIAGGNKLTFSDGTSMDILNGVNGTNGTNGTNGSNGTNGTDAFSPILGVDADGYWTIITAKGGAAVRVKDAAGQDVKAKGADGVTTANVKVVQGVLYIDGNPTNIKSIESAMVFDKLTNTVIITLDGIPYRLPVAANVIMTNTISSVACPTFTEYIGFSWGKAKNITAADEAKRKAFTGKSAGDYFFKSDVGSFLVNPTEVDTKGYAIELVNPNDVSMVPTLSQEWREFGYNGSFVQTRVKAEGGLWALEIAEPSKAQIDALVSAARRGETENLAVRLTKDEYIVRSAYQFNVMENDNSASTVTVPAASSIPTVSCGDTYELGSNLFASVNFADLFKWAFSWSGASTNNPLKQYVTIDGSYIVIDDSAEAVNAIGGKTAEFLLQAVDYNGGYYEHLVKVDISKQTVIDVRLPKVDWTLAEDDLATAATTARENVVNIQLQKLFDELSKYGTAKTTFSYKAVRIFEGNTPITAENFAIEPYAKGTTTGSSNIISQGNAAWTSLNIVFDVTKARPVEYTFEITYENSNEQIARVTVPMKVVNPAMDWSRLFVKNDLFVGDKIKVYGDNEAAQQSGNASYDLSKAFSTRPSAAYFDFKYLGAATSPLIDGKTCGINSNTVGVESKIGIVYHYFTNKNNSVAVTGFDFYATPRSFVADGRISLIKDAKSEVTYDPAGGDNGSILMSDTYVAKTVNGKTDLKVFGVRDGLVRDVRVYPTGVNSNIISVTPVGNDFRISATNNAAGIATATVDLVIIVTDQMGKQLYDTVKVTVKN